MGAQEGCLMCLRCMMVFFNMLLWLAGVAMLGFALWLRYNQVFFPHLAATSDEEVLSAVSAYNIGTYVLMAVGGAIMAIGILGCCGAVKESVCLLGLYFVVLFLLFGVEIGASAWTYLNRDELGDKVGDYFETLVRDKYSSETNTQVAVDYTQSSLKCCGANGPDDWLLSGQFIPLSCGANCTLDCDADEGVYEDILVMILSACMCRAIRQADRDYDKCGTV